MKKIYLMAVGVLLLLSCSNTKDNTAELENMKEQYAELDKKYTELVADYDKLKQEYSVLEEKQKDNNVPQNNCCAEANALRQKIANARATTKKLKDDFNDFQSGFGLTNMIDIDNRIKAVERALR